MGRPVNPPVGHRVAPLQSLAVQVGVVGEAYARPHVAPDVLHPALDLSLGLGPVGLAQTKLEAHPEGKVQHPRASGSGRNGKPGCSLRITCWEQHRPRATTTIPTDKVAGQSATDEVAGHYLGGSILARRSCESTSRRWVNSRSAVRRTGTWWVRSPSAIPGHFSVGVDTEAGQVAK